MRCSCLLMLCLLVPSACFAGKPLPEDPGRIDGWVYRHDYFGLAWKLPEDASLQGRGWTRKAVGEAVRVWGDGPFASVMEEGLAKAPPLVTLTLDQTRKDPDDSVMVMAAAERIPEAFDIRSGEAYLANTIAMMRASGAPVEVRGPVNRRALGGVSFDAQEFTFKDKSLPGGVLISSLLAAIRGNYVFLFSIACGGEEGLLRGNAVLDGARFAGKGWLTAKEMPALCVGEGCKEPADPGDADPEVALAFRHQHGKDIPLDLAQAAKLYRKAAERGNSAAQARLAAMYLEGSGVPKDEKEGARWYAQAAKSGLGWAQAAYASLLRDARGVRRDNAEAVRWYRKAASHRHSGAMYDLAVMRDEGRGVQRSGFEALGWMRAAAAFGDLEAMNYVGMMYLDGAGVPRSSSTAVYWFSAAAEKGHPEAQFNLGRMFFGGQDVPRDLAAALKWFTKAGEQGHGRAQEMLSVMYSQGQGVGQDSLKAFEWTRKAAEGGSWISQFQAGDAYAEGKLVPKDLVEAYAWFSLAAGQGKERAQERLSAISSEMTPEQVNKAKELSLRWRSNGSDRAGK